MLNIHQIDLHLVCSRISHTSYLKMSVHTNRPIASPNKEVNSCANFLKLIYWSYGRHLQVELDQISFFEFVLEDVTLLQIDNFHNYVSQKASFQSQSQTDSLKVLFSKNMHPDKIKFSE